MHLPRNWLAAPFSNGCCTPPFPPLFLAETFNYFFLENPAFPPQTFQLLPQNPNGPGPFSFSTFFNFFQLYISTQKYQVLAMIFGWLRCRLTDIFCVHAWILGCFEPAFTFFRERDAALAKPGSKLYPCEWCTMLRKRPHRKKLLSGYPIRNRIP